MQDTKKRCIFANEIKTTNKMKTKNTTSIAFTAEQLEQLSAAINSRWCEFCHKSTTYGNENAIREGRKDYFETLCDMLSEMELKVWNAQKRLNK